MIHAECCIPPTKLLQGITPISFSDCRGAKLSASIRVTGVGGARPLSAQLMQPRTKSCLVGAIENPSMEVDSGADQESVPDHNAVGIL